MSHDLEPFERTVQSFYGPEFKLDPSYSAQEIISFAGLQCNEIWNFIPSRWGGSKPSFMNTSPIFKYYANHLSYLSKKEGFSKYKFVYCDPANDSSAALVRTEPIVIIFPAINEAKVCHVLKRIERLRVFL